MSEYNQLPYKKPSGLNQLIIVVVIIGILMAVFLTFFLGYQQPIKKAGFKNVVAHFTDKVLVVKSQWLMLGKPGVISVKAHKQKYKTPLLVTVNKLGWVDSNDSENACEHIWLTVMERPLEFFNAPITARLIDNQLTENSLLSNTYNKAKNKYDFWGHHCRYTIKNGQYFEYNSATGAVSNMVN